MEIRDYKYILVPNILRDYKCSSSGECCKSKWKISIDNIAYEKTKKELDKLNEDINVYLEKSGEEYATKFEKGYCKFITEDKLCRVHRDFGWDCLSDTCKVYPRVLKLTPRGMEMSFTFSCRSAAKLLLKEEEFEIVKVKKEDLFIMKPSDVGFIIPENNIPSSFMYRYFNLETFMINILKKEGSVGKKLQYISEKIDEFSACEEIEKYDFIKAEEEFDKYNFTVFEDTGVNDYIIKTILIKGERSKNVSNEFINLLKLIRLVNDLEKDQAFLRDDSFSLTMKDIHEMKRLWTERDERVLKNYLLCLIFCKDFYHTKQFAMMKTVMRGVMLKFRILLNKKYLKRDLTDEELIYTIKSHDNDFSHDGVFFDEFYKKENNINMEDYIKKMIAMLY